MALHDMFEDTPVSADDLRKHFPEFIIESIEALTLNKDVENMEAEVGKCKLNKMTEICRFKDRLNNLINTSTKYNDEAMVRKMINKTKLYFLPNLTQEHQDRLMVEIKRLESELEL